jgi:sugar phosphate isomerase/epimerase
MELSVSNIINRKGLGLDNLEPFLKLLKTNGIPAVELALSCVFKEPADTSPAEFDRLLKMLEKYSVKVSSLHSLTFTRPDLELFKNSESMDTAAEYVASYIAMAKKLNCPNIVFGSGKARKTHGKTREECDMLFDAFLDELDAVCAPVILNIEPLPPVYSEYLNSYDHAFEILDKGGYKNIGVQLDLKALFETNSFQPELLMGRRRCFHHAHVSNMDFSPPDQKDSGKHRLFKAFLQSSGYSGYVSMEAVPQKSDLSLTDIDGYLRSFISLYREEEKL